MTLYTLVLYNLKVFFYFLPWKFLVCAIRNFLTDGFWKDQKFKAWNDCSVLIWIDEYNSVVEFSMCIQVWFKWVSSRCHLHGLDCMMPDIQQSMNTATTCQKNNKILNSQHLLPLKYLFKLTKIWNILIRMKIVTV